MHRHTANIVCMKNITKKKRFSFYYEKMLYITLLLSDLVIRFIFVEDHLYHPP